MKIETVNQPSNTNKSVGQIPSKETIGKEINRFEEFENCLNKEKKIEKNEIVKLDLSWKMIKDDRLEEILSQQKQSIDQLFLVIKLIIFL